MQEIDIISLVGFTLIFVTFLAGFIDAIAGGGGMLTIPAFLFAGMPPHIALGTNKLSSSFGSFTAAITYYRQGLFQFRVWRWHVLATAVGAALGTWLVDQISIDWLYKILPAVIFSVAIFSLAQRFWSKESSLNKPIPKRVASLHGFIIGAYDGVAGPGTGSFWTLSLRFFYGLPLINAIGATKLMNFTSNFVSLLTFLWLGYVDILLGITLGISLMAGAYLGAHTTLKLPTHIISVFFNIFVIGISIRLAMIHWF